VTPKEDDLSNTLENNQYTTWVLWIAILTIAVILGTGITIIIIKKKNTI
jgi:hypothetical protein